MTADQSNGSGRLSGVWPIATTAFDETGRLDLAGIANVIEHILRNGAHGLVYPAIASEFQELDPGERRIAVDHVLDVVAGQRPVIVGISCVDDRTSPLVLAEQAAARDAAAVMLMPRPASGADIDSLRDQFAAVAAACSLPIVLQNAPAPLGPALPVEVIRKIIEAVPAIAYVKEETQPCGQRISRLQETAPASLRGVFGGAGGRFVLDELARGAAGSMPACEFTGLHVRLYEEFVAGNRSEARRLFNQLLPLLNFESVFRTPATKFILHRMGIIDCPCHRDANPGLDAADQRELLAILEGMGALARSGAAVSLGVIRNG